MEEKICQSCGMPMAATEHFGKNKDQSINTDYCCFCFKEGVFTDNFSFTDFITDMVKSYPNPIAASGEHYLTEEEQMLRATVQLQELKRWKSHCSTHQEYYKSVNQVLDFINTHLTSTINLSDLASIATISEFHFHRIFKAIMNESPGEYIQRLRLEKAAFKLQTTDLPLAEIADQTGYKSLYALSRAFKKKMGMTPSEFRKKPADLTIPIKEPVPYHELSPEIRMISPKTIICTQVVNPYIQKNAFLEAWNKLTDFLSLSGVPDKNHEYLCISCDISTLTRPEYCRIYACVNMPEKVRPAGKFGRQALEGGMYAVFTHKGPYKEMKNLYCNIYRYWIPNSPYQLRDTLHFEKYLNTSSEVPEEELLTEVYIPITMP
ncbi:MAG: GyrI-like domain-containing protein [Candidatus Azobacteroides sp.]|nr:GyrI-like domain-containing protein [Candidatus Azobacteroides sp.]